MYSILYMSTLCSASLLILIYPNQYHWTMSLKRISITDNGRISITDNGRSYIFTKHIYYVLHLLLTRKMIRLFFYLTSLSFSSFSRPTSSLSRRCSRISLSLFGAVGVLLLKVSIFFLNFFLIFFLIFSIPVFKNYKHMKEQIKSIT